MTLLLRLLSDTGRDFPIPIGLIVLTIIVGVLIWGLTQFPAIDATFKQVIKVVAIVIVIILWVLWAATAFLGYHGMHTS